MKAAFENYFESTPQIATALTPKLGYEKTAKLVSESLEKGMSVIDLAREKKLVTDDELKTILDIQALTGVSK